MPLTKTPNEVFRNYATDGVPASGPHNPIKGDIRTLLNEIYAAIGGSGGGGIWVDTTNANHFILPAGNVSTTGQGNTAHGIEALIALTSGDNNVALGHQAGDSLTTGDGNTIVGAGAALGSCVVGTNNTAIGLSALASYAGSEGTAVGANALALATGVENTALGTGAGSVITTGTENVFIGHGAGGNAGTQSASVVGAVAVGAGSAAHSNSVVIGRDVASTAANQIVIGDGNVSEFFAFGRSMMKAKPDGLRNYFFGPAGNLTVAAGVGGSGNLNIGIGEGALASLTTGNSHVAIGDLALNAQTTLQNNVAIGTHAMRYSVDADDCTAVGAAAFGSLTTGTGGVAIGRLAGFSLEEALNNTLVGDSAGRFLETGAVNTFIGYRCAEGAIDCDSSVVIGSHAAVARTLGDNNVIIGTDAYGGAGTSAGASNVIIGRQAGLSLGNASTNIIIGQNAGNSGSQLATAQNSIAIGDSTYTIADNEIVLGNPSHTQAYIQASIALGRAVAAPNARTIAAQHVVAGTSNAAGAALTIVGSRGTGTGAGGNIVVQVALPGSAGSSQNSLVNAITVDGTDASSTFGGNVWVNKSSAAININANTGTNPELRFRINSTTKWFFQTDNSDDRLYLWDADASAGVYMAQNATSWASASDARLKTNWSPISVLAAIAANDNVSFIGSFDWLHTGNRAVGALAQDIHKVFPGMVVVGSDGDLPEDAGPADKGVWGLTKDLAGFYALQGIKELLALNRAQAERIAQLEEKVTLLQAA